MSTKIEKNAFFNCRNLKEIRIKSGKLSKIGKNAFRNIKKKAVFRVPRAKVKAYKKLLKKSGLGKKMKVKAM